ncbi:DUF2768 family protein [Salinicoccus sp. YB14-2]|uniref:DUF2768 family protein n=1 Tax=Salinicoccus sp. YB14-2 TaxID=1572701 RepID=UPI001E63681F|nr:DUF2768 family protein [Salinicoccus sp. YB14-2]
MWLSFISMGSMAVAAVLIYVARYVIKIRIISIIVSIFAWGLLLLAFILMIPVLGGS